MARRRGFPESGTWKDGSGWEKGRPGFGRTEMTTGGAENGMDWRSGHGDV